MKCRKRQFDTRASSEYSIEPLEGSSSRIFPEAPIIPLDRWFESRRSSSKIHHPLRRRPPPTNITALANLHPPMHIDRVPRTELDA